MGGWQIYEGCASIDDVGLKWKFSNSCNARFVVFIAAFMLRRIASLRRRSWKPRDVLIVAHILESKNIRRNLPQLIHSSGTVVGYI